MYNLLKIVVSGGYKASVISKEWRNGSPLLICSVAQHFLFVIMMTFMGENHTFGRFK